jgi:ubiquinone/menaquinone biosynthesis C-methylase UbiE
MASTFYTRFGKISKLNIWKNYLESAYPNCIEDFKELEFKPDFKVNNFTALLCGTGNELTSHTFSNFVFSRNPDAEIWIIDISQERIEQSRKYLNQKLPDKKIKHFIADAQELPFEDNSLNYIETDSFFQYLSPEMVQNVLSEWNRTLKDDGFITFRAIAGESLYHQLWHKFRELIFKYYIKENFWKHSTDFLHSSFEKNGFRFVRNKVGAPTFWRYAMLKR